MTLPFQEALLEYVRHFATIEGEQLPPTLARDELLALLSARAGENRRTMEMTNAIIDEHIAPVLKNPHALDDEAADAYSDLALALFSQQVIYDLGLAYSLHKALLRRAHRRRDVDRIIRHLYWCGFACLRLPEQIFTQQAAEYFAEALRHLNRYFTIRNRDTRMLLNRCLGNSYVAQSNMGKKQHDDYRAFFAAVDRALGFWNDPNVRALDPDFPWQAFIHNSHQNVCSWLEPLRREKHANDEYLARRVYESAMTLYGDASFLPNDPYTWTNARTIYIVTAARYHMGMLSAREATDQFQALMDSCAPDDYSEDGVYKSIHVPAYVHEYMLRIPELSGEEKQRETQRLHGAILEYCKRMPSSVSRYLIARSLSAILPTFLQGMDLERSIRTVLEMTTFSHMLTHVHSIMTSLLMEAIAEHFIGRMPEKFIGVCGAQSAGEVLARQAEVLAEIRLAGLAHDAGKFIYIQTVSLSSRRLTEDEFIIIKEHTRIGLKMILEFLGTGCVADVVQGHHKWYDGTYGYPDSFDNLASPFRFIIDIASVADSIDAATDSIGRSYTRQPSLDELIDEIGEQAGTRYSPIIAEALRDEALLAKLRAIITERRPEVYCQVYNSLAHSE